MSRDVYAALSGASATWNQLERIADDLANTSTVAYKRSRASFESYAPAGEPFADMYARMAQTGPDLTDGALNMTGDPMHVALQGQGYFVVDDGGQGLLTRDGRFALDPMGQLTTMQGRPVLGQQGPIRVPPGEQVRIDDLGKVYGSQSGELGQLMTVYAPNASRVGAGLWQAEDAVYPAQPRVVQGALEQSNVDPMKGMVELVEASRYFEAYQKAMQASDDADARLNQSGGPR